MKIRVGVVRAFIAVLWAGLLLVPVGVMTPRGPEVASVGEALAELARGQLGVGILDAFVEGGALTRAATVRVVLIVMATAAFWLAGLLEGTAADEPPQRRRRCPACRGWVSLDMQECPHCGTEVRRGLDPG